MVIIQEIPVARINDFWNIQFQYLVDDGMITEDEEKAYYQSAEYRDVLKGENRTSCTWLILSAMEFESVPPNTALTKVRMENASFWISGFFLSTEETGQGMSALWLCLNALKMMEQNTMP